MGLLPNRKQSKELVADLRDRFVDGEKLSIDDVVKDYFNPKSPYAYLVVKNKVKAWMQLVKRHFKIHQGLWFGNIDDEGHYGVVTTEEEARYALIRYYRYVKGTVAGASLLVSDAGNKGLLPEGMRRERFLLTRPIEEDEDEN